MFEPIIRHFIERETLPASYFEDARNTILPIGQMLLERCQQDRAETLLVGVNGAQGTGKSTLCALLAELLQAGGLNVANLSIDDFYLSHDARSALARRNHPLLASRGVPGTHDLGLLAQTLEDLIQANADSQIALPRFDKSRDDPWPRESWPHVNGPVHVLLLEGWFVGVAPQQSADLVEPVNELEAREDRDGRWRRWVNEQLAGDYQRVFDRFDQLYMLRAPSFEQVYAWRTLQEDKLRQRSAEGAPGVMDEARLRRFIQHFERLTRHSLATLPGRADKIIDVTPDHRLVNRD